MCRAVSLAYGVRDLSSSSVLALCLFLAFDRLLEFLFIRFFSFLFLSGYQMWVLSMLSSEIEDHVWFEDQWMTASWCDE
jgi:hypothetical protein